MAFAALNILGTQFCIRDYQTLCEKFEKLGSEQNYHEEKRKLDPAIATRASLIFIGFQALNQPPAQVNHAQAAIKNVAT